jgi:hypothetical protein
MGLSMGRINYYKTGEGIILARIKEFTISLKINGKF